jgi:hypothetical protein
VQDPIAFNQKEFCLCKAADIWGETDQVLGVMGYWVDNYCFVLHEELLMSLQRGKAAKKSIMSI